VKDWQATGLAENFRSSSCQAEARVFWLASHARDTKHNLQVTNKPNVSILSSKISIPGVGLPSLGWIDLNKLKGRTNDAQS
jgi:hypothetical protein